MSTHYKLRNQRFPDDFLEQAAFQPLTASFYLALGYAVLEILVYYPERVSQSVAQTFAQVFSDLRSVFTEFRVQDSMQTLLDLVEFLKNPATDLATRRQGLEDMISNNNQQSATALQYFCRLCLATWLPQHKEVLLNPASQPPEVELLLGHFCEKFRIVCQFSRAQGLSGVFGPVEMVPVFFLNEAGPGQYVLLYHRKVLDLHKGFAVDIDAFPFMAGNRNTHSRELIEAFAKYCLNQSGGQNILVQVLKQTIQRDPTVQTETIARLLQQMGERSSASDFLAAESSVPPPSRVLPLIGPPSSSPTRHRPTQSCASVLPNISTPKPRPNPAPSPNPHRMLTSQYYCDVCQRYREIEYFRLIHCSGHTICSDCRSQKIRSSKNCPICHRQYSDSELQVLQVAQSSHSSFQCIQCSNTKLQSLRSQCPTNCEVCLECLHLAGLVCPKCHLSVWIKCSVCRQLVSAAQVRVCPCGHLMHEQCQFQRCSTCQGS